MNRQMMVAGLAAALVLLLAGAGVLLYGLSQTETESPPATSAFGDIPKVKVTPPPALEDIAADVRADYPELAKLLENPELSTVYKDFYLAYQSGGEETALALARQRGILNADDQLVMTLVLDSEDSAGLISQIEAEGVLVTGSYKNLVSIAIPVELIRTKAETEAPSDIIDRISNLEHVIRLELPRKATGYQQQSILGQGVGVTLAGNWQAQGFTGEGVKVGVLDLGFAGYRDLLGSELPDSVTVETFGDTTNFANEPHGTACAEIVHEMAPDAEIFLAYYDGTDLAFGLAVDWLKQQGVDIISNSTGSVGVTPMDGTGFSDEQVDEAHQQGIFWVNAAGNEADRHYRGQFTDTDGNTIHEFFPDTEVIPFIPFGPGYETSIILSWNDWQAVDQDYDLILMDRDGNVLAKSEDTQDGQAGAIPAEGFFYEFEDNEIYLLSIENYDNLARGDATFDLFIQNGDFHPDYLVPDHSLSSPADARGAFAVGAVYWSDDALETYSSRGPTTDGRIKPDIAAPSVVDSASYRDEGFNGTSAAAPHVAGAAALVMQALPEFKGQPDELAEFLKARSIDLGDSGPDNTFGAGRLNLGESPQNAAEPEATLPPLTEGVNLQPTSTPRPIADVGLPAPVGLPGNRPPAAPSGESSGSSLGVVVIGGLCLMCAAGLLFVGIIIAAVVVSRRR